LVGYIQAMSRIKERGRNFESMAKLSRKQFLKGSFLTTVALSLGKFDALSATKKLQNQLHFSERKSAIELTTDESFWAEVRAQFTLDKRIINLNNGAVSPQPKTVQETHIQLYQKSNLAPSFYINGEVNNLRETLRNKLAQLVDCHTEEVAINRNTTEGLNSVIFGLRLKRGDEVVVSNYDYPFMLNAWKQREKRDGIVLKYVNLHLPLEDDQAVVNLYRQAITAKTKVVHITHIINWTGQIMPAKRLTEMAQKHGCQVVVDAAHSVGQTPVSFRNIGCDYLATSLHKWLCAPFGTGMLVVRKNRIAKLYPLLSAYNTESADIRKFEFLGTRSYPAEMAVLNALDFQHRIGGEKIIERLRFLKEYWLKKASKMQHIKLNTSTLPQFSAGMATFSINGMTSEKIATHFLDKFNLHVGKINWQQLDAVRISPHIYTTLHELDVLIEAMHELNTHK